MRCIHCGSNELEHDELSGMYYCKKCHRLDDDYDDTNVEVDEQDEKELSVLTLVMLYILQSVPILGFIPTFMIMESDVNEHHKKDFSSKLIAQFIVLFIILCIITWMFIDYRFDYRTLANDTITSVKEFVYSTLVDKEYQTSIPDLESSDLDDYFTEEEFKENVVLIDLPQRNWEYFEGITMTGSKVAKFIEDTSTQYKVSYLLQTQEMVRKNEGKNYYRNLGYALEGYEEINGMTKPKYVIPSKHHKFFIDENNEYVYEDIDDINNSRYIYYIKSRSIFTMELIRNSEDTIIGFKFTELKESK